MEVMGLTGEQHFHALLPCFESCGVVKEGSLFRVLLMMLVTIFAPCEPIIMGMDDTIESRKGAKIKAKGIYRDPVRPLSRSLCHALVDVRWVLLYADSRFISCTSLDKPLIHEWKCKKVTPEARRSLRSRKRWI